MKQLLKILLLLIMMLSGMGLAAWIESIVSAAVW